MTMEKKSFLEKSREQAERLRAERKAQYKAQYKHLENLLDICNGGGILRPKGMLWFRKCPLCGSYVSRVSWPSDTAFRFVYYRCRSCEYEYTESSYED